MEGSAHERFDCEERGGTAPGGQHGRRPGSGHGAQPGLCGGGSHLTASASEQEAAAPLPAGTLAGATQDAQYEDEGAAVAPDGAEAPEADLQSADTAAADGGSGGTTISIAVYRSSFPIVEWDLNDDDYGLTKAEWAWEGRTGELPESASPGAEVEWAAPSGYAEPTRAGFEFAGWSTDKSASAGGFIDGSSPKLTMPEGAPESKDYTLYALWTPLEYSVVFDLAKNPEDGNGPGSDASFELNWESDSGVSRTVTDLGGGRFLVEGFTMDERTYDAVTRTVGLPEPSRTGYRFLGWAEPDGQRLAIDNAAKDGYALNPVRLTQIDGMPVLTARWASAFGVTAPLSVTFGDYDKTGAPGNPWLGDANASAGDDTTQSEADDTTKDERSGYEALGQAYFENTGWHEAVKVVGLSSERSASASDVLTTYDSKQASEAAVLGDGTAANPGERLLSLYPSASAPADKSSGVHFRLSDSLDETALGSTFTMGAQGSGSERLPITYGLNLSTDPVDNSANHGLVLPTDDYSRKQIATVSYTFATATAADEEPVIDKSCFYIVDGAHIYNLSYIKTAAEDIAAYDNGDGTSSSRYYVQFKRFMDNDIPATVEWGDGNVYHARIVGINHDDLADGSGKAALTFEFVELLASTQQFNAQLGNSGGWGSSRLRTYFTGSLWTAGVPDELKAAIVPVTKAYYNGPAHPSTGTAATLKTATEQLFLLSYSEHVDAVKSSWSRLASEGDQYEFYKGKVSEGAANSILVKSPLGSTTPMQWWQRSVWPLQANDCLAVSAQGLPSSGPGPANYLGVCPAFCL